MVMVVYYMMILVSFPVGYSPDEMDYAMVLIVMMMFDDDEMDDDDDDDDVNVDYYNDQVGHSL